MGHFKIIDNGMVRNDCNNGQGKCCGYCQYLTRKEGQWEACSESCLNDRRELGDFHCYQCEHKQPWMKK
mgnify:CR=1 FL=1